ncbi:MAG: SHOCT domain-containing protein [Bacteroidetes bacterium]|jgi:hypothetical protein|nr:SHOCT domain-containing protein [archaeon]MBT7094415.1 SHOCT domain-containing protein [Bacteroidota bacterium]
MLKKIFSYILLILGLFFVLVGILLGSAIGESAGPTVGETAFIIIVGLSLVLYSGKNLFVNKAISNDNVLDKSLLKEQKKGARVEKLEQFKKSNKMKSVVEIDYDKFENKKTIKSKKSIRIDMSDTGALVGSMMSKRGGVLDAMSAAIQYLEMKFRYVETSNSSALMIDLEYYGNNWLFLKDGKLVIRADDNNYDYMPYHQRTNVQDGGKVKENESYLITVDDLLIFSKASNIEGQITGQSVKVPFALNKKQKIIITEFQAAVFTGDDPLFDPGKSGKNTDDLKNTEQSVETSDPPVENNIETEIDLTAELEKLSNLQDKGLINAEEYSLAKKKLLGI